MARSTLDRLKLYGLVGALTLLPTGYGVYEHYWLMQPLGGPCTENKGCRGIRAFCLPDEPARPTVVGLGNTLPTPGSPGICSTFCETDSDCPASIPHCADGALYARILGGNPELFSRPSRNVKLCAASMGP